MGVWKSSAFKDRDGWWGIGGVASLVRGEAAAGMRICLIRSGVLWDLPEGTPQFYCISIKCALWVREPCRNSVELFGFPGPSWVPASARLESHWERPVSTWNSLYLQRPAHRGDSLCVYCPWPYCAPSAGHPCPHPLHRTWNRGSSLRPSTWGKAVASPKCMVLEAEPQCYEWGMQGQCCPGPAGRLILELHIRASQVGKEMPMCTTHGLAHTANSSKTGQQLEDSSFIS